MRSYTLDYYYYYHHHHNHNHYHYNTEMTLTNIRQRWKCETKLDALPNRKIVIMIQGVYKIGQFKAVIVKIVIFFGCYVM